MSGKTKAELLAENKELTTENLKLWGRIEELVGELDDCNKLRKKNRANFAQTIKKADQRQKAGVNTIHGDTTEKWDFFELRYDCYMAQSLTKTSARYLANEETRERFGEGYKRDDSLRKKLRKIEKAKGES